MPNSAVESIQARLEATRRRYNWLLGLTQLSRWLIGCALLFVTLLLLTTLFPSTPLFWKLAFGVWAGGVFALSFWMIWRFLEQYASKQRFVHNVERHLPDLEQRLITSVELEHKNTDGVSQQLLDRLWEDAKGRVEDQGFSTSVATPRTPRVLMWMFAAVLCSVILALVSQQFLTAARQLAWPFQASTTTEVAAVERAPVRIQVEPGDTSLQRGDNIDIVASLDNATSDRLTLYVQEDNVNWRRVTMLPDNGDDTSAKVFSARLSQVTQALDYYVEYAPGGVEYAPGGVEYADGGDDSDDPVRSPQYRINLFDLPRVDKLAVKYDYPDYTGMTDKEEDPGGDVVAPVGTDIQLEATFNKAVNQAELVFEDGTRQSLEVDQSRATGTFTVEQDTGYHIQLVDRQEKKNKDPLNYYVRAIADREPEISLKTPGRDQEVMPLEEVPIEIRAEDDYGLTEFVFNYSVTGRDGKTIDFLKAQADDKQVSHTGSTLLYLEDLDVQPGDVISYSVSVADNNGLAGPNKVVSDIYFLQVIPTDHEFSRANSGGGMSGGGGGGGDSSALVKTQKDVIAATWKLNNRKDEAEPEDFEADGKIIRDSQAEVAERAKMSISRLTERGTYQNDKYQIAVEALQTAISEMETAIDNLDQLVLNDALAAEQKALREILKAESQINRTQVAMNRNRGGGGGGQRRENEDLRELFEMEMGELENRYELPQRQSQQARTQQQNETLDKLKELARRQERLTRSQRELARREEQMTEEQRRRQLEKLRRQQEELRRELADLSRDASESSASQSNASSGNNRQQSSQQQQTQQALQEAMQQMQQASSSDSPGQAAAKSQKALDALNRQAQAMSQGQQQSVAELQESAKKNVEQMVSEQRRLREALEALSREQSLGNTRTESANTEEVNRLARQQSELKESMDMLDDQLRQIARRAGEEDGRTMQQSHELSRSLRPIEEKMDTSNMILKRGMVNLSLRMENEIESKLADLRERVQGIGQYGPRESEDTEAQVASQVKDLRQSLEQLQRQAQAFDEPDSAEVRRGERSGALQQQQAESASRQQMQQTLNRSRQLAQNLEQLGRAGGPGGQNWAGNARSINTELTQKDLEEFLSRPELLEGLLKPVMELENQLRVQTELNELDKKLYSEFDEEVPEEYKSLVENYYRELSESKNQSGRER